MISQSELQNEFIRSAIHVVAEKGLEHASTRSIAAYAQRNETYIYHCFSGKDELFAAALHWEDTRFVDHLRKAMPVMYEESYSWKERCFHLWKSVWEYLITKEDHLRFYLRYYYSAGCRKYAYAEHLEYFQKVIEIGSPSFRSDAELEPLLHQIFDTMLCFGLRTIEGELPVGEETTRWTFEQIYAFLLPHFRAGRVSLGESH